MPSIRTFACAALLALAVFSTPESFAAPPAHEDVQRDLDALADRKLPETEHKALQQVLEQTLGFLSDRDNSEVRAEALQKQLEQAPKLTTQAHRELEQLKGTVTLEANRRYAGLSVAQLEQRLNERSQQLAEWQKALTEANSLIITAQTRPERAQTEIAQNQARLQQIGSILKSGREAGKALSSEARDRLAAEQVALEARTRLRRAELSGNSTLLDLGASQRALLNERISRAEQEFLELQSLINDRRRTLSEQTVEELSREAEKAGSDRLLIRESQANLKLSDTLLKYTEQLNEVTQQNLQVRRQLDSLTQSERALEEQVNVLQGSLLLAKILYQQKQALPQVSLDGRLSNQIADLRLYQFEINQQREQLSNPASYVEQRLADSKDDQLTAEERRTLLDLARTRSELLERLNRELNTLLNESITLQLNQKQLQSMIEMVSNTLDEQIFWIPSNRPLDLDWLKELPQRLQNQLVSLPWGVGLREFAAGLSERPLVFLPLLLVIGVLIWRRGDFYRRLRAVHADIGHYKRDSQLHTPLALLFNLLLALPGSLFLALCGYALQLDARGQNASLAAACFEMAQAWLVLYTAYRVLAPNGLAEMHFRWARAQVHFLHRQMRGLGLVVLILVAVVTIAEQHPGALADDVLGILVVIGCYLLMIWLLLRLLLKGPTSENAPPLRLAIGLLFAALPLALIVAVGFGYYYTALKLTDRLIDTLYVLVLWVGVEAILVRGLGVAARRLAYQRAIAERQAVPKESPDGGEIVEAPVLDIEQINQQSLRLLRMTLFGVFLVALYWVWADLLSVFSYLDNVTLYQYANAAGDLTSISLNNLLGALLIIGITVALARNLPGLLEVLVLSRLTLAPGSVYATTTLLSYTLVGVGFVTTLSTLGVSWDRLQWLVAALSVGLGFGLQEIFANFISGLIILFEKPIRIGDVVTIGNLSGSVSRIRIRATTITDFDRKDIIVPNKTFITGQLVNWSLTDTVTRVTIRVGVAYGSDLELVRKLLLQAANDNSRVLRDPAPIVYFLTFGESTLDHELRIHVRELGDRNPTVDEINRVIDREFRANGIEIAFRQLDIYLKNAAGQECRIAGESSQTPPQRPAEPEASNQPPAP